MFPLTSSNVIAVFVSELPEVVFNCIRRSADKVNVYIETGQMASGDLLKHRKS